MIMKEKISRVAVVLKSKTHRSQERCAYIYGSGYTAAYGSKNYPCYFFEIPKGNAPITKCLPAIAGTLRTDLWTPSRIIIFYENHSKSSEIFGSMQKKEYIWGKIDDVLKKLPGNGTYSKPNFDKGPLAEIKNKYRHTTSSIYITPDSWLDNKLQEVYTKGKDNK